MVRPPALRRAPLTLAPLFNMSHSENILSAMISGDASSGRKNSFGLQEVTPSDLIPEFSAGAVMWRLAVAIQFAAHCIPRRKAFITLASARYNAQMDSKREASSRVVSLPLRSPKEPEPLRQ
jgi:hypothetical protein